MIVVHDPEVSENSWDIIRAAHSSPTNGLPGGGDAPLAFRTARLDLVAPAVRLRRRRSCDATAGGGASAAFAAWRWTGVTLLGPLRRPGRADGDPQCDRPACPARTRPDETFIYTAHWDHMGRGRPDSTGDVIYNGAMDNAGGVAGLIELARLFAAGPRPERSILFIATTLEESGLLGAEYYARHPLYPLETTVGGINMDAVNLFGPTGTMEVTGLGKTDLEDHLGRELAATGRRMQDDPNSVVGFYYRSDHFPFARAGVPFLFAGSGWELVPRARPEPPRPAGRHPLPSALGRMGGKPRFRRRGARHDALLPGRPRLANSREWPQWRPGAEFRAIRMRSDARRR